MPRSPFPPGSVVVFVSLAALTALGAAIAGCSPGRQEPLDLARDLLEAGRGQAAYRIAAHVAASESLSTDAYLLVARCALQTLRTGEGIAAAERAIALSPQDPRAHHVLAYLNQRRRRNLAALESADEAVRLAPDVAAYRVGVGELLLGGGMVGTADYSGAEEAFRAALRLDPDDVRARAGLAKTYTLAGRGDEAERELETCLAERPYHCECRYLRGLLRLRRRDFDGAEADLRFAARVSPQNPAYVINLARVLQHLGKTDEAREVRRVYGNSRTMEGNVVDLETAYHTDSGNVSAGGQLAQLLLASERPVEALNLFETLCDGWPELPGVHLGRAEAAQRVGRLEEAWDAVTRALEIAPGNAHARLLASRIAVQRDLPMTGVEHARKAKEISRNDPEVDLALADILREAGDAQGAVDVYRSIRRRNPEDPRVMAGLGRSLSEAGKHREAVKALNAALQARPRNPRWLYWRGVARAGAGDLGWAEEDLRSAIAINPDHVRAYEALAELLDGAGRREDARAARKAAGDLRERERRLREAKASFHQRPRDRGVAATLAVLLEEGGNQTDAMRVLARADAFEGEP